ncbi:MAG: pantoate--beta-alanine ligase [Planctomycetes bacterium]|nr:pantoate--beta-alanine ligase [Planctomycetota bacterium]
MEVFNKLPEIVRTVENYRNSGLKIGFVPTMGALHAGHLSLIKNARLDCDKVVVSIYVNPTQFGANEDLNKYPKPFERDFELCCAEGVDMIMHLKDSDMYSANYRTYVNVEYLTETLCGATRPRHFRGVTTIVAKLFNLSKPHVAYFGQKDAQQAIVIKRMAADLNFDVTVKICPILREDDGLALSSRNIFLSSEHRKQAVALQKGLQKAMQLYDAGETNPQILINAVTKTIKHDSTGRIDYVELVSVENLHPISEANEKALLAVAVFFDKTRLIDNQLLPADTTI